MTLQFLSWKPDACFPAFDSRLTFVLLWPWECDIRKRIPILLLAVLDSCHHSENKSHWPAKGKWEKCGGEQSCLCWGHLRTSSHWLIFQLAAEAEASQIEMSWVQPRSAIHQPTHVLINKNKCLLLHVPLKCCLFLYSIIVAMGNWLALLLYNSPEGKDPEACFAFSKFPLANIHK